MNLKKQKNKLLIFLFLISFIIMPNSAYAYAKEVIVGGENIGIEIKSDGILIVGFYAIDGVSPGKEAGLEVGDRIIKIDDTAIKKIDDLSNFISGQEAKLNITYKRKNKVLQTTLTLRQSENSFKTGLYVKDSIVGIGTLTFIDPNTKSFGALGHEIIEKSTGSKFETKEGTIFKSEITGIEKANRNTPGEKEANFNTSIIYGTINKNEISGIYGTYKNKLDSSKLMEVGEPTLITIGEAIIRTVIDGNKVEEFTINIIKTTDEETTKNIIFEITDEELIKKTNGIVQGMSGSPIIQNNKIIGAVTHVIVDNPTKGYGIFITNMLKEIE